MSVKVPVMDNGMYLGGMSLEQEKLIMELRNSRVVPTMKKTILQIPSEYVLRSIEEQRSVREILKEEKRDITEFAGELRDYQTIGSAFMYFSPRSMIADGVGLGKTAEVAALINWLFMKGECKRFLMAVETGAIGQTQCELIKMTGMNIVTLSSEASKMKREIRKTDWSKVQGIVVKHTALRSDVFSRWLAENLNEDGTCRVFDTFFLDESSVIKNNKTKMYQYTYNICNLATRVHFMNATAFETKMLDIYYQLDMMNPVLLNPESKIKGKYCTYGKKSFWKSVNGAPKMQYRFEVTGYKNQEDFKKSLQLVYFGRTKQDIGMDRPNVYKVYTCEPTQKQIIAIDEGKRYAEVLNCPSLIDGLGIGTNAAEVPKIARLVELVDNEFSDSKVMIYVFHREAQRAIAEELKKIGRKPLILNGETEQMDKLKTQIEFNTGDCDVIITNAKKSLNLNGGDVCIMYSLITNPSTMIQVAGRIDRNVDDRIKTFVLMLYEKTPEYSYFRDVVAKRSKDSRELTIDAESAVDYFLKAIEDGDVNR